MSRNPILNDKAFGTDSAGLSPSEEWASAQAGGLGAAAGGASEAAWQRASNQPQQAQPYAQPRPAQSGGPVIGSVDGHKTMTVGGVSAASLVMFVFLIIGAFVGWAQISVSPVGQALDGSIVYTADLRSPVLFFAALIGAFALAIVTAFMPKIARFTAVPYALLEGVVLGAISHLYEVDSSGIVLQAILATFGVFAVMLLLYGLRILRATPKFVKGVIAATFGIMVMYLAGWIISLFSSSFTPFWASSGAMGVLISVVIVVVAALNLILDFDFIERGSQNNLPSYMDWYAAFGLMVTLVWLYLEMLRLLSKLRN
ncbi:MAG: Bax inhibitor-1/YccA family protein [Microthrixaceae bacterium]|nr:Bax inhibitor-1/YccA family protein [Microthrixaceae bacterium]